MSVQSEGLNETQAEASDLSTTSLGGWVTATRCSTRRQELAV